MKKLTPDSMYDNLNKINLKISTRDFILTSRAIYRVFRLSKIAGLTLTTESKHRSIVSSYL